MFNYRLGTLDSNFLGSSYFSCLGSSFFTIPAKFSKFLKEFIVFLGSGLFCFEPEAIF